MKTVLTDQAFSRLVAEDVKNKVDATQRNYLRSPEVANRWRTALLDLLKDLDEQRKNLDIKENRELTGIRTLPNPNKLLVETKATFAHAKERLSRFRFHVEKKLAEADRLIALGETSENPESFLMKSIQTHQRLFDEWGVEPTPIDEALWASMLGRWEYGDITQEQMEPFLEED